MIYNKFRIDIADDLDYGDLIADIYFEDQIIAMLTQEHGFENMEIKIYPPKTRDFWAFKFSEFEEAIQYAKLRLWELRKAP
jgi:hypothetical protein